VAEGVAGEEARGCGPSAEDPSEVDCNDAVHQLYDYLDGELTDERRRQIAVHLDRCGHCARAAGFESELRSVIANCCRDRVPDALISRVARVIHDEASRHDAAPTGRGGTP
jgi:mycothiol system anti-sigma-R factor